MSCRIDGAEYQPTKGDTTPTKGDRPPRWESVRGEKEFEGTLRKETTRAFTATGREMSDLVKNLHCLPHEAP